MGLADVKEEILAEARATASSLLDDARQQVKQIQKEADKDITTFRREAEAKQRRSLEALQRKLSARAKFDGQRMIMESKQMLLHKVILRVKQKIQGLPHEEQKAFLQGLLSKAKKEMEVSRVLLREEDRELLKGIPGNSITITGGLIAENNDGSLRMNYSLDGLLEAAQQEFFVELSNILFQSKEVPHASSAKR